jgi:glycosyltransferase involved in cell wall biosynthesis
VDVELIAAVARLRPHYSFVLLGDHRVRVDSLRAVPNVHLLGRRPYSELPAYCAAFRAALMPFRLTKMTQAVNPIKMHEYLAAGLPVVGTSIPEARRHEGLVTIADTAEQFALACDGALRSTDDRADISHSVANQTWEARVETLSRIVMTHVNGYPASRDMEFLLPDRAALTSKKLTAPLSANAATSNAAPPVDSAASTRL